jgi:hypothetical protein
MVNFLRTVRQQSRRIWRKPHHIREDIALFH